VIFLKGSEFLPFAALGVGRSNGGKLCSV